MGKNLNKFGLSHLGVVVWTILLGVILSPAAIAFTASDLANGWTFWGEDGAVLMTWERPSSSESSRILGFEIRRNFGLRDIVLRGEDEFWAGYDIDASEPAGIEVVDLEIDSATGGLILVSRDFIPWLPDEEGNPTWEEFLNDNWDLLGIDLTTTFVHFGWVPSGPSIGRPQTYGIRPIILVQDRNGQWHLQLGEFSTTPNLVVPVGPAVPVSAEGVGNSAFFEFETTYGTDEAILQVAREPSVGESLVSYFLPERTLNQVVNGFNPTGASLIIDVDLSGVPGSGNVFRWRIGSRNRQSTNRARPWPATAGYLVGSIADSDYGWVWSDAQWWGVPATFSDVSPGFWAFPEIETIAEAGITQGYPDGTYRPSDAVTRDQMAVYISRAMAGGDENVPDQGCTEPLFPDVACDYWARKYIGYCADHGVVSGYPEGDFRPSFEIDRASATVLLSRARGWIELEDDMASAPALFPDVPAGFWAGTAIEACLDHHAIYGYSDGYFRPEATVTRDQLAMFIDRAFLE